MSSQSDVVKILAPLFGHPGLIQSYEHQEDVLRIELKLVPTAVREVELSGLGSEEFLGVFHNYSPPFQLCADVIDNEGGDRASRERGTSIEL